MERARVVKPNEHATSWPGKGRQTATDAHSDKLHENIFQPRCKASIFLIRLEIRINRIRTAHKSALYV